MDLFLYKRSNTPELRARGDVFCTSLRRPKVLQNVHDWHRTIAANGSSFGRGAALSDGGTQGRLAVSLPSNASSFSFIEAGAGASGLAFCTLTVSLTQLSGGRCYSVARRAVDQCCSALSVSLMLSSLHCHQTTIATNNKSCSSDASTLAPLCAILVSYGVAP